jgi:D-aminoacyl-tRNA deacylase
MPGAIIAYTTEDPAGSNVARRLHELYGFKPSEMILEAGTELRAWEYHSVKLVELHTRLSNASEYLSQVPSFAAGLVIFASRHKAESGRPSFTVHSTGNWGDDPQWGGNPHELGKTSAKAIASAYRWFKDNPHDGFELSLEATHHGPTSLHSPSVFVELGSSEKEWKKTDAGGHLASCVMAVAQNWSSEQGRTALGMGGTHYASKFNPLEGKEFNFSFICPKHALDNFSTQMLKQAIAKTAEKVECIVLDWKGTTLPQRDAVRAAAQECGLEVVRE